MLQKYISEISNIKFEYWVENMIQKNKIINFWYIIIALSLITIGIWFVFEINKNKNIKTINKADESLSKPISDKIDLVLLDELKNRQQISESNLSSIRTYNDIKNELLEDTKVKSKKSPLIVSPVMEEASPAAY